MPADKRDSTAPDSAPGQPRKQSGWGALRERSPVTGGGLTANGSPAKPETNKKWRVMSNLAGKNRRAVALSKLKPKGQER